MDDGSLLALFLLAAATAAVWMARDTTRRLSERGTAVPPAELKMMRLAATEAMTMARAGRVAEGYTRLLTGRRRALELREEVGEPWTESLMQWYQAVLDYYISRYGTE